MICGLQWDSTINLSDILTLLSVIAIFITLIEMRFQRKENNLVDISVQSSTYLDLTSDINIRSFLEVKNVSNTSIVDLSVNFLFSYSALERCFESISLESKFKFLNHRKGTVIVDKSTLITLDDYSQSCDDILPMDKIEIDLPYLYTSGFYKFYDKFFTEKSDELRYFPNYLPMIIKIEYYNIKGDKYSKFFYSELLFNGYSYDTKTLKSRLNVVSIKQKWYRDMKKEILADDKSIK